MFTRIANLTWNHPKAVLSAVAVFTLVAAALGGRVEDHLLAAGFTDPSSESERAINLLREELGYDATPGIVTLIREQDGGRLDITSPAVRDEVERLSQRLKRARHVGRVVNPLRRLDALEAKAERAARAQQAAIETAAAAQATALASGVPPPAAPPPAPTAQKPPTTAELARELRRKSPLIADDGRSLVISGHLTVQDVEDKGGEAAEDAAQLVTSKRLNVGFTGFAPGFNAVNDQTREDLLRAELIAFPVLAILLLIVFRGVIAALIPLGIGVISILGAFLGMRIMSEFVDTSIFALNIATALSLGLAVDYALLMVSRYREELERDGPSREAHRRMVETAGRTVVFSGFTVAVAMAALIIFPQRFLYSVGAAGATVGVLASITALLAVPSLLALLGTRVNALSVRRGHAVSDESDSWYRLAHGVMRRPIPVALISSAVLLIAAMPLFSTHLTGGSAEAIPPGLPPYEVTERIRADYTSETMEPITVTVRGRVGDERLERFGDWVGRTPGIESASPFQQVSKRIAYANFGPKGKALDRSAEDAVNAIRDRGAPQGTELLVSGNTARFVDQKQSLADRLPLVVAIVATTTLVLLFLLTGSIVLPIKTLLMNMLTLAATLGIIVLGFQHGWLHNPLDYVGPEAVEVSTLILLFAITFGLATDYAVLVMARITEQHNLGMSNEEAVATGIGRTGRVITAAAIMLAVVFLAFATSSIFFMKQAAIGQAAGVILDATIVRALLVPSLMRLFGDWNWWAPGPLRRLHERFGLSEGPASLSVERSPSG